MTVPGKTHSVLVPNATGVAQRGYDVSADIHTGDIRVGEGSLKDWMAEIEAKIDTILEAIALNHQRGPDGKCVPECWSCRVEETMEGIRVSRRIQGK